MNPAKIPQAVMPFRINERVYDDSNTNLSPSEINHLFSQARTEDVSGVEEVCTDNSKLARKINQSLKHTPFIKKIGGVDYIFGFDEKGAYALSGFERVDLGAKPEEVLANVARMQRDAFRLRSYDA